MNGQRKRDLRMYVFVFTLPTISFQNSLQPRLPFLPRHPLSYPLVYSDRQSANARPFSFLEFRLFLDSSILVRARVCANTNREHGCNAPGTIEQSEGNRHFPPHQTGHPPPPSHLLDKDRTRDRHLFKSNLRMKKRMPSRRARRCDTALHLDGLGFRELRVEFPLEGIFVFIIAYLLASCISSVTSTSAAALSV